MPSGSPALDRVSQQIGELAGHVSALAAMAQRVAPAILAVTTSQSQSSSTTSTHRADLPPPASGVHPSPSDVPSPSGGPAPLTGLPNTSLGSHAAAPIGDMMLFDRVPTPIAVIPEVGEEFVCPETLPTGQGGAPADCRFQGGLDLVRQLAIAKRFTLSADRAQQLGRIAIEVLSTTEVRWNQRVSCAGWERPTHAAHAIIYWALHGRRPYFDEQGVLQPGERVAQRHRRYRGKGNSTGLPEGASSSFAVLVDPPHAGVSDRTGSSGVSELLAALGGDLVAADPSTEPPLPGSVLAPNSVLAPTAAVESTIASATASPMAAAVTMPSAPPSTAEIEADGALSDAVFAELEASTAALVAVASRGASSISILDRMTSIVERGGASGAASVQVEAAGLTAYIRRDAALAATLDQTDELSQVELFAGIGGRLTGSVLHTQRHDGVKWRLLAAERQESFATVLSHNLPTATTFIMNIDGATPPLSPLPTHLLSGGPPCTPFSQAGLGAGAADPRNGFPAAIAMVQKMRPLVVEFENVVALAKRHPAVLQGVVQDLTAIGYWVSTHSVDCSRYGVPQRRKRLLLLASLLGPLDLPLPRASPPRTVRDAIGEGTVFDAFRTSRPSLALSGKEQRDCAAFDIMMGCRRPRELHADEPARTLTSTNLANRTRMMLRLRTEGGELRTLTPVEAAALQSFPSTFEVPANVSDRQALIGVGNAFPPELAYDMSVHIYAFIRRAQSLWLSVRLLASGRAPGSAAAPVPEGVPGSVRPPQSPPPPPQPSASGYGPPSSSATLLVAAARGRLSRRCLQEMRRLATRIESAARRRRARCLVGALRVGHPPAARLLAAARIQAVARGRQTRLLRNPLPPSHGSHGDTLCTRALYVAGSSGDQGLPPTVGRCVAVTIAPGHQALGPAATVEVVSGSNGVASGLHVAVAQPPLAAPLPPLGARRPPRCPSVSQGLVATFGSCPATDGVHCRRCGAGPPVDVSSEHLFHLLWRSLHNDDDPATFIFTPAQQDALTVVLHAHFQWADVAISTRSAVTEAIPFLLAAFVHTDSAADLLAATRERYIRCDSAAFAAPWGVSLSSGVGENGWGHVLMITRDLLNRSSTGATLRPVLGDGAGGMGDVWHARTTRRVRIPVSTPVRDVPGVGPVCASCLKLHPVCIVNSVFAPAFSSQSASVWDKLLSDVRIANRASIEAGTAFLGVGCTEDHVRTVQTSRDWPLQPFVPATAGPSLPPAAATEGDATRLLPPRRPSLRLGYRIVCPALSGRSVPVPEGVMPFAFDGQAARTNMWVATLETIEGDSLTLIVDAAERCVVAQSPPQSIIRAPAPEWAWNMAGPVTSPKVRGLPKARWYWYAFRRGQQGQFFSTSGAWATPAEVAGEVRLRRSEHRDSIPPPRVIPSARVQQICDVEDLDMWRHDVCLRPQPRPIIDRLVIPDRRSRNRDRSRDRSSAIGAFVEPAESESSDSDGDIAATPSQQRGRANDVWRGGGRAGRGRGPGRGFGRGSASTSTLRMTNETVGLELAPPDLADPLDSTFDVRPLDGRAAGGQEATPSTVGAKDAARTGLEPPPRGVPRLVTQPVEAVGGACAAPPPPTPTSNSAFDVRPLDGRAAGGQEATPSTADSQGEARLEGVGTGLRGKAQLGPAGADAAATSQPVVALVDAMFDSLLATLPSEAPGEADKCCSSSARDTVAHVAAATADAGAELRTAAVSAQASLPTRAQFQSALLAAIVAKTRPMMNRLQDTIAFYEQARQRNFDHIQSRSRGLVAAANQFARHQHHTTISGATISGGVRPPGPELLHARPLLLKDVAFKGKDGNTLHYRPEVLADTGGSFSVIDESTVADMERRGCVGETVRWPAQQREYSMHGVGGIGVTVVGVCTLQFYLRDIETNEWRCYQERFHVIKGAPIFLLGLPFARQNNFVIDVGQNEIVLDAARPEGQEGVDRIRVACEEAADSRDSIVAAVTNNYAPLVYAAKETVVKGWSDSKVELQLPTSLAGQKVYLLVMDPRDTESYAVQRGLRLSEVIVEPDENGRAWALLRNYSSKKCIVPAHTAVGGYLLRPETQVTSDLSVNEILDALHIFSDSPKQADERRERVRQRLFNELNRRRDHYFSNTRTGCGVGPPMKLEPTPEHLASDKPPPNIRSRPIAAGEPLEALREQYRQQVKDNVLLPGSTSPYGSPVVMVRKPKGGWRQAQDFRHINEILVKQHYPLPHVQDCLDALGRSSIYTTLDMINAFWQQPLDPESRKYTCVNYPWGDRAEFLVCPMGMQASSACFQRSMDLLLSGLQPELCISYIDDCLIHTAGSFDDHLIAVVRVLDRIGGGGYTLRPKKCYIGYPSVEFLGHIVGGDGNRPNTALVQQIDDQVFPLDTRGLTTWLGWIKWYSKFIPMSGPKVGILQDRVTSRKQSPPTRDELEVFLYIKAALTDPGCVLARPDFDKTFYVITDAASTVGGGATLAQIDDEGNERPISYYSVRWQPSSGERRWHPIEHECGAAYKAVRRWKQYLMGRRFVMITDMEALTFIRQTRHLSGKLLTWALEFQAFDVEFVHRPGRLMCVDGLSRLAAYMRETTRPPDVAPRPGSMIGAVAASLAVPYNRRRVSCVIFSATHVLLRSTGNGLFTLPAEYKLGRQEPLREVAARALGREISGGDAAALDLLYHANYCVGDSTTRHYLCMVDEREFAPLLDGQARFVQLLPSVERGAGWILDLSSHMWQHADDKRMVARLVHFARDLQEGSVAAHHPALRAAVDERLLRSATANAVLAVLPMNQLGDGRSPPTAVIDSRSALVRALAAIDAHVSHCRQHPELSPSRRTVEERRAVAVMAVDYEYDMKRQHMGVALAQVAIGELIYVFDAWKLSDDLFGAVPVDGHPSLRHWLESEEVVVVAQACSGDCKLLLEQHNVRPACVFDTAEADVLLRSGKNRTSRGLGVLIEEYVGFRLPHKGRLDVGKVDFFARPLDAVAFEYSWHDVAWCVALYHRQRELLQPRGWLLSTAYEISNSRVYQRLAPPIVERLSLVAANWGRVLVTIDEQPVRARLALGTTGVTLRLCVSAALPSAGITPVSVADFPLAGRRLVSNTLRSRVAALASDVGSPSVARVAVPAVCPNPRWSGEIWHITARITAVPLTDGRGSRLRLLHAAGALTAVGHRDRQALLMSLHKLHISPPSLLSTLTPLVAPLLRADPAWNSPLSAWNSPLSPQMAFPAQPRVPSARGGEASGPHGHDHAIIDASSGAQAYRLHCGMPRSQWWSAHVSVEWWSAHVRRTDMAVIIQGAVRRRRAIITLTWTRQLVVTTELALALRRDEDPLSGSASLTLRRALDFTAEASTPSGVCQRQLNAMAAIRMDLDALLQEDDHPDGNHQSDATDIVAVMSGRPPWCQDLVHPNIRCIIDPAQPRGLRRGAMLVNCPPLAEGEHRILMVCTGETTTSTSISSLQSRYALSFQNSEWLLLANPLNNAWALVNEPPEGHSANCIFQTIDYEQEATDSNEVGKPRRPGLRPVVRSRPYPDSRTGWSVAVVVQVAPLGPDGRLYVHYGKGYKRDYEPGASARCTPRLTNRDLEAFLTEIDMAAHAERALGLCAAPVERNAIRARRALYAGHRTVRIARNADIEGEVRSVPTITVRPKPVITITDSVNAATKRRVPESMNDVEWILVVVHSGKQIATLRRPAAVGGAPASLVLERSCKEAKGRFAAVLAIQTALGPLWEAAGCSYREAEVVYHGVERCKSTAIYSMNFQTFARSDPERLLQASFAMRNPTATTQTKYPSYQLVHQGEVEAVLPSEHVQIVRKVLVERGLLNTPVDLTLEKLEDTWATDTTTFDVSEKDRQAFISSDPFLGEEPLVWSELTEDRDEKAIRVIAPSPQVPPLAAPFYGSAAHEHVAGKFAAREPETWDRERPTRSDIADLGMGDGPGGGEQAEAVVSHDPGRCAPRLDRAGDFLKRLMPAAPMVTTDKILKLQQADDWCVSKTELVRSAMEAAASSLARAKLVRVSLRADGDCVRLHLDTQAGRGGRRKKLLAAKHRKANGDPEDFMLSPEGALLHLTTDPTGLAVGEYVIPPGEERDTLLTAAHDCTGHKGRDATREALRLGRFWWPNIDSDVKTHCKRCRTCAYNKTGPHIGAMHTPRKGREPWQVVGVDIVDLEETPSGFSKCVIFSDRLSRGIRAAPCTPKINSEEFLNIILYYLVAEGIKPALLISDHDSVMISALCDEYYKAFKIERSVADGDMHTAVGTNERFNGVLRAMARAAHFDSGCLWDVYLPLLILFYNATKHPATGYSPYFLEHGREPSLPWTLARLGPDSSAPELVQRHATGLHLAWDLAYRALSAEEARRRTQHNIRYQTNIVFTPGERVLVLARGPYRNKMLMPYVGPYRIVEGPDPRDRYRLRDLGLSNQNPWFHVSRLKHWPDSAEDVRDLGEEYYIIQTIKGHRQLRSAGEPAYEFLVKWRGYNESHNQWVTEEQFNLAAQEMLLNYKQEHGLLRPAAAPAAAPGGPNLPARPPRGRRAGRQPADSGGSAERAQLQEQSRAQRRAARERAKLAVRA